jgi:hypothetical protein
MLKELISVTVVTNNCIKRLWETYIGTIEYSIATTFRSTCIDIILYWKYGTVPYIFLFTLIHMFQRIMGIEWIMISLWQYGLVRPLYGTVPQCSAVRYLTVPWYQQSTDNSQHYIFKFGIRPHWHYLLFEVTSPLYWCALCYWKTRINLYVT